MKHDPLHIPRWQSVLLAFWMWPVVTVDTLFSAILGLLFVFPVSLLIDRGSRRTTHIVAIAWAKVLFTLTFIWTIRVKGRRHIDRKKNYVLVVNHQSLLDIMALIYAIPLHIVYLAKRELFSIPFMGWYMHAMRYIPVDRASRESGRKALARCAFMLKKKVSVVFFPEGTRTPDGQIHAFKSGAFQLASVEGVDILPVVIDGTGTAMPKKSIFVNRRSVFRVSVLEPVKVGLGPKAVESAKRHVREKMIQELAAMRAEGF
ncbi:MAG: lysophospholipid acyltransferase family protein [Candidatus Omnitrophota bacterium]